MDGPAINQKIRFGYYKAAQKLGQPFNLYRATNFFNPIQPANFIGIIKAVATVDWTWMKANKPGNAIWFLTIDGRTISEPLSFREMDFIVGDHTFYCLSKEYQLPIQGVETNATIRIIRPDHNDSKGEQGYSGYTPATSIVLATDLPASILIDRSGSKAITKLPTDTKQTEWKILFPHLDSTDFKTGDVIIDQSNQQYILMATEETEFGWRMSAQQTVN